MAASRRLQKVTILDYKFIGKPHELIFLRLLRETILK